MLVESIVSVILTLVIAYLYVRRNRKAICIAVLPLSFVPLFNILGTQFSASLNKAVTVGVFEWRIIFVVIGPVLSCSFTGFISHKIQSVLYRRAYLILCGAFSVIFSILVIVSLQS